MKHPAILLACLLLLGACHRSGRPVTLQGETQGTYYSIIYFDPGQRNLQPQVDSLLQLVDRTASLWNEHSLIRRINSGQDSLITPLFHDLVDKASTIRHYTHGAFDCRIGTLVSLYGFGFKRRADIRPGQIDTLMAQLTPQAYTLRPPPAAAGAPPASRRRHPPGPHRRAGKRVARIGRIK